MASLRARCKLLSLRNVSSHYTVNCPPSLMSNVHLCSSVLTGVLNSRPSPAATGRNTFLGIQQENTSWKPKRNPRGWEANTILALAHPASPAHSGASSAHCLPASHPCVPSAHFTLQTPCEKKQHERWLSREHSLTRADSHRCWEF